MPIYIGVVDDALLKGFILSLLSHARVLIMHPNFPGQFRHLAPALQQAGADVRAISFSTATSDTGVAVTYATFVRGNPATLDPWLHSLDSKIIRGRSVEPILHQWQAEGWQPTLVIGHTGWGDMLGVADIFPEALQLGWFEFFYHTHQSDLDFDPEFPPSNALRTKARLKNMWPLWMLDQVDHGVCPTYFQRDTHPSVYHDKLSVIHEGIDTSRFVPKADVSITLGDGLTLTRNDKVVTFFNRDLEPLRGYHVFMRALPALLEKHPDVHVLIVGGDGVSYGAPPESGSWKQHYLEEVGRQLDPKRVHFLGRVPHNTLIGLMQLSRAHVYLTYPFVLSWSLLEAMSCQAPIVGSDTAPVREVITHGENGLLVDFFDQQALVEQISYCLMQPDAARLLGEQARETVIAQYDLHSRCLPAQLALIDSLLEKQKPQAAC
tara:strand:+ start:52298 stop:53602 length:1305 start_codon:yes stop_codon:yes gene_type:complete